MNDFNDLAEKNAKLIPVKIWRFCAYKSEADYDKGEHYFVKDFFDHIELKNFSAKLSAIEKKRYPDYCSMYWRIILMN